ncbi:hypothetical protein [Actinomadura sp. NPDC000929]|uniref:hypothetical protein n=1 Tax=Actinomadura sp. NPDC000929 TaxID=3154517 RepID=UPI003390C31D
MGSLPEGVVHDWRGVVVLLCSQRGGFVWHQLAARLALSSAQGVGSSPVDGSGDVPFSAFRAALEKSKTARAERRGALEASATARMLSGFADGPFTIDSRNRTVPLRRRPPKPTSPSVQRSPWPEPRGEQSGVRLVQDNGRSAVRRRPTLRATPPSVRTRTVKGSVYSDPWIVTPPGVMDTRSLTLDGAASGIA